MHTFSMSSWSMRLPVVVLPLSGVNDFLNTVIPVDNGIYHDSRPTVRVSEADLLPIDTTLAFHPRLSRFNDLFNQGMVAVVQGIGYPNHNRSHFRGMDIWHTCEAEKVGTEGWLGRVIREFDPKKENVVTAVSFGPCLFRALAVPGVPVACVAAYQRRTIASARTNHRCARRGRRDSRNGPS